MGPWIGPLVVLALALSGCSGGTQPGNGTNPPGTNPPSTPVIETNPYNGTYFGLWDYTLGCINGECQEYHGSFRLTIVVASQGMGGDALSITGVTADDPWFGCQMGCTPAAGSRIVMPDDPPTTPSNPSSAGDGILIEFANGRTLMTNSDQAGFVAVTTDARILSNGLGAPAGDRWSAATQGNWWSDDVIEGEEAFHYEDCPDEEPGSGCQIFFDGWSLTKSAL